MVVVDAWKGLKIGDLNSLSIGEFANILAGELIDEAYALEKKDKVSLNALIQNEVTCNIISSSVSSISRVKACSTHTKKILKNGKQLRCLWCSRVNLTERKTTLKCLECGKGFCRDEKNGLSCWSHHIALGGIPAAPKHGTRKKKLYETLEDV